MINLLNSFVTACAEYQGKGAPEARFVLFRNLCIYHHISYRVVNRAGARANILAELRSCYRYFPGCGYGRSNRGRCIEILKS